MGVLETVGEILEFAVGREVEYAKVVEGKG